jgi:Tol biopolymer transport system component/subtilisin family serine protease
MKRYGLSKVLGICGILTILLVNCFWPVPVMSSGIEPAENTENKVSSLLSMHIKLKETQAAHTYQSNMQPFGADSMLTTENTLINQERVFLHFAAPPTPTQIHDLNSLGVTVYPDSWIPPVNNFKTGFVLADMPLYKLDALAAKSYIVTLDTAEQKLSPQNDLAREAMNVEPVWNEGYDGSGVTVAVLDSGLDTSNPDFPTPVAVKDYSSYPVLDDTIANTVTGHGTHVTGSLLGRGTHSATYKGVAPGADLVFLKVGNDTDGMASSSTVAYAIRDAVDVYHAKIINLSYGGWSQYHDGSDQTCQAVDYATSRGTTVFTAAGNEAQNRWHYTGVVRAQSTTPEIPLNVSSVTSYLGLNLVWFDGPGDHNGLSLQYYDSHHTRLSPLSGEQSESIRGTESNLYQMSTAANSGEYYFKVKNISGSDQVFHLYYMGDSISVTFNQDEQLYTIASPAEADSAIAVGAYISRNEWTNYKGRYYTTNFENVGYQADFSANGPRVDSGAPEKPNIIAPGSFIISARDPVYTQGNNKYDPLIIDDDGLSNGAGPANYFVMEGTSMASPMAAGIAALLLQINPTFTPAQIRHYLETTASNIRTGRHNSDGWGLVNAKKALTSNTILDTYSDADLTIPCHNFKSTSNLNDVYVYISGTGFLIDHRYNVSCYDGANNLITTLDTISSSNQIAAALKINPDAIAGTWHVLVFEPEFLPPLAYNSNSAFTILSTSFNFQNSPSGLPLVISNPASGLTDTCVTLNGNLIDLGIESSVKVYFEYGLNSTFNQSTEPQTKNTPGIFSAKIRDLVPDRIYYFRAKAEGGNGKVATGVKMVFATPTAQLPDKVAFSSNGSIYKMNIDSSHQIILTSGPTDWGPVWSPDGSKIAYVHSNSQIMVMDADGSNQTIVRNCDPLSSKPSWSPDGTKLVYSERIEANSSYAAICTINIDGSGWQEIASDHSYGYTQPSWSPDGSKIAFVAMYAPGGIGGLQVFTMNMDGSDQTKITDTANSQSLYPTWSPDSSKIAYAAGPRIHIVNSDGTNNLDLSQTPSGVRNYYPSWSPDGTKIIYASNRGGTVNHLCVMDIEGTDDTQIDNDSFERSHPSWTAHSSPAPIVRTDKATNVTMNTSRLNGQVIDLGKATLCKISFQWGTITGDYSHETQVQEVTDTGSYFFDLSGLTQGTTYFYRFKAIGNGVKYGEEMTFYTPSYANLKGKIAYSSNRDGNSEIYIMNADGSEQTRLTNNNVKDSLAVLSPDGSKIAFLSWRDGPESRIYVMNSDGSNPINLTNNNAMNYKPTWSPDGTRIAYTAKVDNHNHIFIMNSDGTNQQQITFNSGFEDGNPTWSPDSTQIAFESSGNTYQQIYISNADGTNLRCLTYSNEHCFYPTWSPDGSKIAYQTIYGTAEGWVWMKIQTVNIDGSHIFDVYDRVSPGHAMSWSPDGKKIAFTSFKSPNYDIYAINIDGSNLIRLTTNSAWDADPSWSIDSWVSPTVTTNLSSATSTGVVLQGTLLDPGTASNVLVSFDWHSDNNDTGGNISGVPTSLTTSGIFESHLTGLKDGQTYHYRAKAIGNGTVYGDDVTFTYYAPRIVFMSPVQNITAGVVSNLVTVQLQDISGNPFQVEDKVELSLKSSSIQGKFDTEYDGPFSGTTSFITIVSGSYSTKFYYKDTLAGSPTITIAGDGLIDSTQQETINADHAANIGIETNIGGNETMISDRNLVCGDSLSVFAVTCDQYGNFISNASGTWSLINKTGGVIDSDLVPSEDGRSALFTGNSMGTARIKVESNSLNSITSGIITVLPKLHITDFLSPITAGTVNSFTVSALNGSGAIETAYTGTVHFTSIDKQAVLPGDYTFTNNDKGTHQFTTTLKTAGLQSLTAIDTTTSSITVTQSDITVIAAGANQISIETVGNGKGNILPSQTIFSGSSVKGYAITRDAYGNFIANSVGKWSLANLTGGVVDNDLIIAADRKSAIFAGHVVGSTSIHVTSPELTSIDSGKFTVLAGVTSTFNISGFPDSISIGNLSDFTLTAQDTSGNTTRGYAGTVHFNSSDTTATLPDNYTFVENDNGIHTFRAMLNTVGNQSITAADALIGSINSIRYNIVVYVDLLTITTTTLPDAEIGQLYSQPLTATGGEGYIWSIAAGSLPPGLSIKGSTICGTPKEVLTAPKIHTFTICVTNSYTETEKMVMSITIHPAMSITTISLMKGFVGKPYNQILSAKGGSKNYTWSIVESTPPGLSIEGQSITGTPTQAGAFSFHIQVDDGIGRVTSDKLLTLQIYDTLIITTDKLPDGNAKASYSVILEASGGLNPYKWSKSGKWPAGLSLSTRGVISGKPATTGTISFSVKLTDSTKAIVEKAFTITIHSQVTITAPKPPNGDIGVAYSLVPNASGGTGTGTYKWSHKKDLPPGLSLNDDTGKIYGIPTTPGNYSFSLTVSDGLQGTASKSLSIKIYPDLSITTTSLKEARVGKAYSMGLKAAGGSRKYTWSLVDGSDPLPDWVDQVKFATKGIITPIKGLKPDITGYYDLIFKVKDSIGDSALSQPLRLTVK